MNPIIVRPRLGGAMDISAQMQDHQRLLQASLRTDGVRIKAARWAAATVRPILIHLTTPATAAAVMVTALCSLPPDQPMDMAVHHLLLRISVPRASFIRI